MAEVSRGGDPGRLLFKVTSLSVQTNDLTLVLCATVSAVGWDPLDVYIKQFFHPALAGFVSTDTHCCRCAITHQFINHLCQEHRFWSHLQLCFVLGYLFVYLFCHIPSRKHIYENRKEIIFNSDSQHQSTRRSTEEMAKTHWFQPPKCENIWWPLGR